MEPATQLEDQGVDASPEEAEPVFRGASWAWRHRLMNPLLWAIYGVTLLGCFAAWRQGEATLPIAATVLGATSIVIAGWVVARHQSNRRWSVRFTEEGLALTTDGRTQPLAFSGLGFSVDSKRVSFGKSTESVHRRVFLHSGTGTQVISARLEHPEDFLAMQGLLERLTAGVIRSAREDMARGGRIEGAGWGADAKGISSTTRTGRVQQVPWSDVTHHENLGAAHLFWATDGVRPWLRLPSSSRNAAVLAALIDRPAEPATVGAPHGRLLWAFKANRAPTFIGGLMLAAGLLATVWLLWEGESPLGGLMITGLGAWLAWAGRRAELRTAFHEHAVIAYRGRERQELPYASASAFSYERHVLSEAGLHIGVKGALSLIPSDGGAPLTALTEADRMDEDEPIVVLRERLARLWQPRLLEQLAKHGWVEWAAGVRLRRDGLQLDPGASGERIVPWSRLRAQWDDRFQQTLLLLEARGTDGQPAEVRVLAELASSAPGFHAGKQLCEDLRAAAVPTVVESLEDGALRMAAVASAAEASVTEASADADVPVEPDHDPTARPEGTSVTDAGADADVPVEPDHDPTARPEGSGEDGEDPGGEAPRAPVTVRAMTYPIGTPGRPWGAPEIAQWRSLQTKQRSYADEVLAQVKRLEDRFDLVEYGHLSEAGEDYPLFALRSRDWDERRPLALITGGVHGYETSGVQGALHFAAHDAAAYAGRFDLLIAPCVSPWAYERIHRWNPQAVDPNRSFRPDSPSGEAEALMRLVAPWRERFRLHIDLHETTDTDETEFRPALAARDGKTSAPGEIPDGFYLVGDTPNPQLAFQSAIIEAVSKVTHIAPADAAGQIIGAPVVAPGVILYPVAELGLCASVTRAPFVTTTEVYPDSPRTNPEQCNLAQVAAVRAALDFVEAS